MKKAIITGLLALGLITSPQEASAQKVEKFGLFDHYSAAVTLGLGGIGFDAATCIGEYVQARVGGQFFPKIGLSADLDVEELSDLPSGVGLPASAPNAVGFDANLAFNSGKVLFDIFPFPKKSNFHVTAGFYFGGSDILTLSNSQDGIFNQFLVSDPSHPGQKIQPVGVTLGDYTLKPDNHGNLEAGLTVNSFRPYLGLGFGRAVPRKRVGFMFELGAQFWGTPKIYVDGADGRHNLTDDDLSHSDSDGGGIVSTISKIKVYPMMTFRITGRIL